VKAVMTVTVAATVVKVVQTSLMATPFTANEHKRGSGAQIGEDRH
jgi:hypothetical protein